MDQCRKLESGMLWLKKKKEKKEIMDKIHKIYFCLFDGTKIGQSPNNQIRGAVFLSYTLKDLLQSSE